MTSWPPPPLPGTTDPDLWRERARRYRRQVANYCQLCEWRTITWHGHVIVRARLEVHHRYGRNVINAEGYESDAELMTLCVRHHHRITKEHQRRGVALGYLTATKRRGQCRTIDARGYSELIAAVTREAERWIGPRLSRGWRRTLRGLPTHLTQPGG